MTTAKRTDSKGQTLFYGEYERKDGRYEYRYKDLNGDTIHIYAGRLSELRHKESKISYLNHINITKKIRDITLNDQFEIWIASKLNIREYTRNNYQYTYDTYVRHSLGKMLIDEITTFDIKHHYMSLIIEKRVSVVTVSHIQNVIFQVFQSAVERGAIFINPAVRACRDFERSHSKHTSTRPGIYKKQADAFLEYLMTSEEGKEWYPLFYMFIYTGLRISEMAGLTWEDIDFENRMIDVNHSLVYCNRNGKKAGFHIFPPKTEAGFRKIPLSKRTMEVLLLEKENQIRKGIRCHVSIDGYTDFVFLNRFGNVISQAPVNRALERAVMNYNKNHKDDENGVPILIPKLTTHSLRHSFANILCEQGVNPKVLQKLMGQSDIATTFDIYTSVSGDFAMREYIRIVNKDDDLAK